MVQNMVAPVGHRCPSGGAVLELEPYSIPWRALVCREVPIQGSRAVGMPLCKSASSLTEQPEPKYSSTPLSR